jgi:hypothetical protein
MPYCTVAQVGDFARTWARNGLFVNPSGTDPGTNPTLSAVTSWVANISHQMDLALAQHFLQTPIPVTNLTAYGAVSIYVAQVVADLVAAHRGEGRLMADKFVGKGVSRMAVINAEINDWIEQNVDGLVASGVAQIVNIAKKYSVSAGSLWKST